ncbi:hypothetical protein ACQP2F_21250 [Actinoplanes sp. CA-030573]|uniref:hypothetical protein n=1 Tax=Actinoplanes sp. CA-030573 TaxID=3239898 RepID=UPI003D90A067
MNEIPHDVGAAVRAVAAEGPGYGGEGLEGVARRARRRRARQVTAACTAAAAAVAVVGFVAASGGLRPVPRPAPLPAAAATAGSPAPSQRLLLADAAGRYRVNGQTATLGGDQRIGELGADGRLTTHAVHGADGWDRAIGLPDGRIVALGPHDTAPGSHRPDGPGVTGLEINLVVATASGDIQIKRDVRRPGAPVSLLAADATSAYLWRPAGLVGHDLSSGRERLLVPEPTIGGEVQAADLAGRRLVVSRAADPCSLLVFDTAGGRPAGSVDVGKDCHFVNGLRLSPDGSGLAIVHDDGMIAVARDGRVVADRPIPGFAAGKQAPSVDLAWRDPRTVRGVIVPIGPGTQRLTTFTVDAG